nr:polysaccharide biosynthesis C-terminal domain-containing protein [uncultured Pseudodesulfovibrio sp.]
MADHFSKLYNKTSRQLKHDIAASIVICGAGVGLAGAAFFLIGATFDRAVLGTFNLSYFFFIITGQIAAFGIQNAALYYVPLVTDNIAAKCRVGTTVILLVALVSPCISICLYFSSDFFSILFSIPQLNYALKVVACACPLFALNKVILNYLNGLQKILAYSIFSGLRIIILCLCIIAAVLKGIDSDHLALVFPVTEAILATIMFIYCLKCHLFALPHLDLGTIGETLKFGFKSLPIGIIHEVNTRVDVVMLGFFLTESSIGIYTLPAITIESILLIGYTVRRSMDPILTRLFSTGNMNEISKIIRFCTTKGVLASAALTTLASAAFCVVVTYIPSLSEYTESMIYLVYLAPGAIIWGALLPVSGFFIQTGSPQVQTFLIATQITLNATLNAILIPWLGTQGAAMGTGSSLLLFSALFVFLLKRALHPSSKGPTRSK